MTNDELFEKLPLGAFIRRRSGEAWRDGSGGVWYGVIVEPCDDDDVDDAGDNDADYSHRVIEDFDGARVWWNQFCSWASDAASESEGIEAFVPFSNNTQFFAEESTATASPTADPAQTMTNADLFKQLPLGSVIRRRDNLREQGTLVEASDPDDARRGHHDIEHPDGSRTRWVAYASWYSKESGPKGIEVVALPQ